MHKITWLLTVNSWLLALIMEGKTLERVRSIDWLKCNRNCSHTFQTSTLVKLCALHTSTFTSIDPLVSNLFTVFKLRVMACLLGLRFTVSSFVELLISQGTKRKNINKTYYDESKTGWSCIHDRDCSPLLFTLSSLWT